LQAAAAPIERIPFSFHDTAIFSKRYEEVVPSGVEGASAALGRAPPPPQAQYAQHDAESLAAMELVQRKNVSLADTSLPMENYQDFQEVVQSGQDGAGAPAAPSGAPSPPPVQEPQMQQLQGSLQAEAGGAAGDDDDDDDDMADMAADLARDMGAGEGEERQSSPPLAGDEAVPMEG
jgi:hypothetical protein